MDVVLERGQVVESIHRVHLAAVDASGRLRAWSGDPERVTFMRSAAKPFQALPLVLDGACDALGISDEELAVCCGSHGGEEGHLATVRRLLERAGRREDQLACGPHPPMHRESEERLLARGDEILAIHNNCSGKHAGMLALARHRGWDPTGYHRLEHPVQQRMLTEVAHWTGIPTSRIRVAVDGCGVPCFALPLTAMARGLARLVAAARERDPGPVRILEAMGRHPFQVAGTGRLCTELMEASGGQVVAKVGAEGVYVAARRDGSVALALKVEDGSRRAAEVALIRALDVMDALGTEVGGRLGERARPVVHNTRGEPAAHLRPRGGPVWSADPGPVGS
jgi:L-asparaginase II